jgi:alkylation response protein AidB-like acyl-CoA dehydrogenase
VFDLDVSDERLAVRDLGRGLGLDVLSPAAKEAERSRGIPAAVARALHESGLTVLAHEADGGGGIPEVGTHMVAVEALAYGDPGITMAALWAGAGALFLSRCATPAQAAASMPSLLADPASTGVVALYEGFGRAPSEFTTTMTEEPGGTWRVRGRKLCVANADAAAVLIVVGVDPSSGRLRAALFAGGTRHNGVMATRDDERLALGAAPTFTVTIDATVHDDDLLGGRHADPTALDHAVGWFRLLVAAAQCGTAQRATDYASKYATERIAFGKPIATFQGVSFMLADSAIRIGAARLEMLDAAAHIDAGISGSEDAVNKAVNYCGAVATAATRDAIQVLGGHGFITDHPVELWYRSSAALSVLDHDPLLANFEPAL